MILFLKRLSFILIANLSFCMSFAHATAHIPGTFRTDRGDVSLQLLEQVFGLVDGVLFGSGTQVIGKMFGVFNAAVIALGGIFLTYTLLVSTINTAQDGEVMGKQWSSIWIPTRVTAGVALLVPKASGYCMMQVFVMWIVVQGVGAANQIWDAALTYLEDGGVLSSVPLITKQKQVDGKQEPVLLDDEKLAEAAHLFDSVMCMRSLDHAFLDWENKVQDAGFPLKQRAPVFFETANILDAWAAHQDKSKPLNVPLPNFQESPYNKMNGMCGQITIDPFVFSEEDKAKITQNGRSDAFENMQFKTQESVLLATQQMMDELHKVALLVADRNEEQLRLYREGLVTEADIVEHGGAAGDDLPESGHCQDDSCGQWLPQDSTLTGYELQTSVLSYYALVMPFLDQLSRTAEELKFIPDAKHKGWLMAGSYFFDMTRLNTKLENIKPENFFRVKVSNKSYNSVINSHEAFKHIQNKVTDGHIVPIDLYDHFIKNTYVGEGEKKRLGRGIQGIWRKDIDKDIKAPLDNHLVDNLQHLQKRQIPSSIHKKVEYKSFFRFANVVKVPFAQKDKVSCSITRLYKCLDENIMIGMWNLLVSVLQLAADFINTFFFAPLEKLLDLTLGTLIDMSLRNIFQTVTSIDVHPIISIANLGQGLMDFTWDAFLKIMTLFLVIVIIPFLGFQYAKIMWDLIGQRIVALLLVGLTIFGYTFAFYAPMLPYMIFLFSALGWMIAVIESMIAGPIVALGLTHPEGQNPVFGKAENAIMLIINVFLRPSLMIIGYIIGIVLSYAFIIFMAQSFAYINNQVMGVGQFVPKSTLQSIQDQIIHFRGAGGKTGIVSVLGPVMMLILFIFMYLEIVKKCFSLIHILPDQILRWLSGGAPEQFGNVTAGPMESATQQLYQRGQDQITPTPKILDGINAKTRYAAEQQARQQQNAASPSSDQGNATGQT